MPWFGLRSINVAFSDHTHFLKTIIGMPASSHPTLEMQHHTTSLAKEYFNSDKKVLQYRCDLKVLTFSQVETNNKNQRKNVNIVLPISFNICFVCSKEPSH